MRGVPSIPTPIASGEIRYAAQTRRENIRAQKRRLRLNQLYAAQQEVRERCERTWLREACTAGERALRAEATIAATAGDECIRATRDGAALRMREYAYPRKSYAEQDYARVKSEHRQHRRARGDSSERRARVWYEVTASSARSVMLACAAEYAHRCAGSAGGWQAGEDR